MKHARLLSTVAAGLLLSTAAFAQAPSKDNTPASPSPAPAAQQSAPAEKTAPSMKAGQPGAETHKAPGAMGQAPAAQNGNPDKAVDKGSMEKSTQNAPLKPSDGNNTGKPNAAQNAPANAAPNAQPKSSQSTTTEQRSTTGQGSAAGSAKLSTEQRTKITTVFKTQKVERVEPSKLNISISVGTRVPSTVKYHPIPQEVIVIYPEWRGFDYILVGDQIVVLDPQTHEIVAVLEA